MKVHFLLRTLNDKTGGGSHFNSLEYIRTLRQHGHEVVVHVLYPTGNAFPSDITPIVHQGLGLGHLGERAYIADLLKQYEQEADIFFLYSAEFLYGGGLYRRRGGTTPVLVYLDAYLASMRLATQTAWSMQWYQYKRWPWDKTVGLRDARHIDRFLPCSPAVAEIYKKFGFPASRFTVLPNIVSVPIGLPSSAKSTSKKIRIIYAGRLIYEKGPDLLLDALARLSDIDWELTILGDGPLRSVLENRIQKFNLNARILGWLPSREVQQFYRDADIFVHPARWPEPFGRTIIEALAAGLPAIIPSTGGSAWAAGEAGLVFKAGNTEDLVTRLRELMLDNSMRQRLGGHGPAQARQFGPEAIYPQLEGILQSQCVGDAARVAGSIL